MVEVFAFCSVARPRATIIVSPRVGVVGHVEVGAMGYSAGAGSSDAPAGIEVLADRPCVLLGATSPRRLPFNIYIYISRLLI